MTEQPESLSTAPDGRPDFVQPAWRQDFPIDRPEDVYVMRRDFTKFMVLTSLAFAVGQSWILIQNWLRKRRGAPSRKAIAKRSDIPIGGALAFHYPGEANACLLLRPDAQTFVAYDQKCTHLSCAVTPNVNEGCLHCPCHNARFALDDGRAISGPPRRPLPRITLEVIGGTVYATGVEFRTT